MPATALIAAAGIFDLYKSSPVSYTHLDVYKRQEKDLSTEKKIFGKDFAYIRDISNFSRIVGRYMIKQLDSDE